MRELKTGLYADKFATFCMFPESFCRSFALQMSFIHFTIGETQVDLRDLENRDYFMESACVQDFHTSW